MQRHCEYTFPTIERPCFLPGPCKGIIKKSLFEKSSRVELRNASLPGYELGSRGIVLSRIVGIGIWRIMARNDLGGEKKTSCVVWNDSDSSREVCFSRYDITDTLETGMAFCIANSFMPKTGFPRNDGRLTDLHCGIFQKIKHCIVTAATASN
jgi:hypothetical protein